VLKKLAIVLVAVVALLVALPGRGPSLSPSSAEAYPGADNFQVVAQECLSSNNVRLQMQWTSYNLGAQWFDVSFYNNGWLWGTFKGAGPIASGQGSFVWEGFTPGMRHYLRVNTLTQFGWYESQTYTFTTRTCFGGGGGPGPVGPKVGQHCDGVAWCAGDPIPALCAQQGLYAGCVWVNRIYANSVYNPGDPISICYWVPSPGYVYIQTTRIPTNGVTVALNDWDDGNGDCLQGNAGLFGDRRTALRFNGNYVDQVLWRVN
jgi:hypothetical protein